MTTKSNGWLKIHRKITDWERYSDVNVRIVFLHLLFTANHEEKKRRGQTLAPGELITSYGSLAKSVGLTPKQVRLALHKLQTTNEVVQQTASKRQRLSLTNWGKYQDREEGEGRQKATKRHSKGTQRATDKEIKNIRNKEIYSSDIIIRQPTLDGISSFVAWARTQSKGIDNAIADQGLAHYLTMQTAEVEKLHRLDGYTRDQIDKVIAHIPSDPFWSKNVLSLASLRKKKSGDPRTKFDKIIDGLHSTSSSSIRTL